MAFNLSSFLARGRNASTSGVLGSANRNTLPFGSSRPTTTITPSLVSNKTSTLGVNPFPVPSQKTISGPGTLMANAAAGNQALKAIAKPVTPQPIPQIVPSSVQPMQIVPNVPQITPSSPVNGIPQGTLNPMGFSEMSTSMPLDQVVDPAVEQVPFKVDFNGVYPASAINSTRTSSDLQKLLADNQAKISEYQQSLLDAMNPTEAETTLESQIADIRNQAAVRSGELQQFDLDTQQGVMGLEGQGRGITTGIVGGQQKKLFDQRQFERQSGELQLQTLADQEANLLTRLGLEQNKRQTLVDKAKTALGFAQQNTDNQFKINDALQKEQENFLTQASQLRDDARQVFSTILTQFKGLEFSELDPDSQNQLAQLSIQAGIPIGLLQSGMNVSKNEQLKESLEIMKLQKDLQETSGLGLSGEMIQDAINRGYVTPDQIKLYAQQVAGGVTPASLKDPTQAQSSAANFATRIQQANPVFDQLESQFTGTFSKFPTFERFKSEDRKLFEQAERNFINAVLRRESGAVISPQEFKEARLQYLPAPGDTEEVLKQKRANRLLVQNNFMNEAGRAVNQGGNQNDPLGLFSSNPLGFNQESQTSSNGKLNPLAASIVQQESGGNYNAVGQPTKYGVALGKYQILPSFHFQKIGLKDTPADRQKFLQNPQLQDQLFNIIIGDLTKQYKGDPYKIAAAYYGGDGAARIVGTPAADKPQMAGGKKFPSINEYARSVVSRLS